MDLKNGHTHKEDSIEAVMNNSYFRTEIVWKNVIKIVIYHLGMIYGLFLLISLQVPLATILWSFAVMFLSNEGVTMGSHRLWSHRSFKASAALKFILMLGQTMAGQNCIWIWARDHRVHHKYSDTDADPHNSNRGFFFCHIGWLMMKKLPDVKIKEKTIDVSDLDADPWVMFQKKYFFYVHLVFAFFIPMAVPVYFWGDSWTNGLFVAYFARLMISVHAVLAINSIAHLYGTRPYTKDINPVESSFVSFITSGEGWHNYHHTFPWDYKAGEFGKHFNFSATLIEWCARFGLANDLRSTTSEMVTHRICKKGDGTHLLSKKMYLNNNNNSSSNSEQEMNIDIDDIFGEKINKFITVTNKVTTA